MARRLNLGKMKHNNKNSEALPASPVGDGIVLLDLYIYIGMYTVATPKTGDLV